MLFSLIIPVYNTEKYLVKCIESIRKQTYGDFEAILVDDGSTDRSPEICDHYAETDQRFKVIHKKNGGLVSARNAGLFAAAGDYITYIDSDDWTDIHLLEFVHKKLEEYNYSLDMLKFGAHEVFSDRIDTVKCEAEEGFYDRKRLEREIFPYLLSDSRKPFHRSTFMFAHTWSKFFKREIQMEHYCRDTRIRMLTDVPLTYESILNCRNAYISNQKLYFYNRTNENSIRNMGRSNYLTENTVYLIEYLNEHLPDYWKDMRRQIDDYAALLVSRAIREDLDETGSVKETAEFVKEKLAETGLLKKIRTGKLEAKAKAVIILLKIGFYRLAVILAAGNTTGQKTKGTKNIRGKSKPVKKPVINRSLAACLQGHGAT